LTGGGGAVDVYQHRGVETGAERPYVRHPTGREVATNVDLGRFATGEMDGVATALQANGFRYVRQSFAWSEIEPEPGAFRWERHDAMVQAFTRHGLVPIAVLHRSPAWVRAAEAPGAIDAPPRDIEDFGRFVAAVVGRYGDRVPFVQLWDRPNQEAQWGNSTVDGAAYTNLLARGANAARTAGAAGIVLAELAPAVGGATATAADLRFLASVYAAGGGAFFDIGAVALDGGGRSPYDRLVAPGVANLSRAVLYREVMVAHGDASKPLWATRFGWNTGAESGVDPSAQATFVAAGVGRARAEWPWLGLMVAWQFLPESPAAVNGASEVGYALLEPDGEATPLFRAFGRIAATLPQIAPTGFTPVASEPFFYGGDWDPQVLEQGTFRTTSEIGARVVLRFSGTGVTAVLRLGPDAGAVIATVDGRPVPLTLSSGRAFNLDVELARGLPDGRHELALVLAGPGQLTIGGVLIERDLPDAWPVVVLCGVGVLFVALGLREAIFTVGQRLGHLQRRLGVELWPELPQLPEWRPARRA